jgi:DNA-binding transcriptional LysR family regulator
VLLFHRDHHGVTLTDAGRALVSEADALLSRASAARRKVRAAGTPPATLTVGFRPGIIITDVVQRFTEQHPDVAVLTQRVEWDEQDAAVLDGRVDLAWIRKPRGRARRFQGAGIQVVPLFDDPEMVAIPIGHRLAAQESVTIGDLDEATIVSFDTAPAHHVGRPSQISGVRTLEEKLEAVALGHGLALVPASAAAYYQRNDVVYRHVADAPPYQVAGPISASHCNVQPTW